MADGLGGHQAGEVASALALDVLEKRAPKHADAHALDEAARAANDAVIEAAREGRGRTGMGTTLTAAVVEDARLVISHVGDSRAYLLHAGALSRLTQDHSMVADMIRQGTLTEEESRSHPNRSVITRALGSDPDMLPDSFDVDVTVGDRLMLSSDGLHGQVSDAEIGEILSRATEPGTAVRALIDAANDAGGADNVTVVVVDIGSGSRASVSVSTDAAVKPRPTAAQTAATWLGRLAWVVAVAAVLAGAWFSVKAWADSRAYLRADNGLVTVYQGVPGQFAGMRLDSLAETTDVAVDRLRPDIAARLTEPGGVQVASLAAARALVRQYRSQESPSGTSTPSPSPSTATTPASGAP